MKHTLKGFTISELLIALAILGVIAVFTIPKILNSGSNAKNNAIFKDTMAQVQGAWDDYRIENVVTTTTSKGVILPYLNYVKEYNATHIDNRPGQGTYDCTLVAQKCYVLHNGAIIGFLPTLTYQNTSTTSALSYLVDPDGTLTNNQDSASISVYANGHLTSAANRFANSYYSGSGPYNPTASDDPAWLSWDGK